MLAAGELETLPGHLGGRTVAAHARAELGAVGAAVALVPVLAHVSINFVMKSTFAAEPFYVTVTPP